MILTFGIDLSSSCYNQVVTKKVDKHSNNKQLLSCHANIYVLGHFSTLALLKWPVAVSKPYLVSKQLGHLKT